LKRTNWCVFDVIQNFDGIIRFGRLAPTSQPRSSLHAILRSSQRAAVLHLVPQEVGISQFRYLKLPHMQRVFGHAAPPQLLPYRAAGCCLPLRLTASAARDCQFRGSIPRLRLPLSRLRRTPYGLRRMTRGQNDWLGLSVQLFYLLLHVRFLAHLSVRPSTPIHQGTWSPDFLSTSLRGRGYLK